MQISKKKYPTVLNRRVLGFNENVIEELGSRPYTLSFFFWHSNTSFYYILNLKIQILLKMLMKHYIHKYCQILSDYDIMYIC